MNTEQASTGRHAVGPHRDQDDRLGPVFELAESCLYEADHARQVTNIALSLFDGLVGLHGLDKEWRYWLTCAGLLHDIGWSDTSHPHHKASLQIILESQRLSWGRRQRLIVGSVARYHRKAAPGPSHAHFMELDESDRKGVRALAGILRVADALDRTHQSVVQSVRCHVTDRCIELICTCELEGLKEQAKALEKGNVLVSEFQRTLEIKWCQQ